MAITVEVCVDSLDSALQAEEGGAHRLELCSNLAEGGVTPSHALIKAVCSAVACKVHVLIRPRTGDFLYSPDELEVMRGDAVHAVTECGAAGIVVGFLTPRGEIDTDATSAFVDLCAVLRCDLTFHRAFDVTRDLLASLSALEGCGVKRVLTSGGAPDVEQGMDVIAALVKQAAASSAPGGGVSIMAGGGVTEANAETLVISTEVTEVHGSFRRTVPTGMRFLRPGMFFSPAPASEATDTGVADHRRWERLVTNADTVRAVVEQLERLDEDRRRRNME